jgi:hypothetical protein
MHGRAFDSLALYPVVANLIQQKLKKHHRGKHNLCLTLFTFLLATYTFVPVSIFSSKN